MDSKKWSKREYTFGNEFTIGDVCEIKTSKFTTFKGEPTDPTEISIETKVVIQNVLELTCTNIIEFWLGRYLQKSCLKKLDFFIISDDKKYYRFMLFLTKNGKECKICENKPKNVNHQIYVIEYGVYLEVIVPAEKFPATPKNMENLLKSALNNINVLKEDQKKETCRVLINAKDEEKKTLEEIYQFITEFKDDKKDYKTACAVRLSEVNNLPDYKISNDTEFRSFLAHLYTCYRKIELILEDTDKTSEHILHNCNKLIENCAKTTANIGFNLVTAKKKFIETIKADKNDLKKLYPVMKDLFQCYLNYLEYCIDNRIDIDEGDRLPYKYQDFKSILKQLNTFKAIKINDDWYPIYENCNPYLVINKNHKNINQIQKLFEEKDKQGLKDERGIKDEQGLKDERGMKDEHKKIDEYKIVEENKTTESEPYIRYYQKEKSFFGLVDISEAIPKKCNDDDDNTYLQLEAPCPQDCTKDKRIWFCKKCGEIIKVNCFILSCSCGKFKYSEDLFECTNENHKNTTIDASESNLPKDSIKLIRQLKKYIYNTKNIDDGITIYKTIHFLIYDPNSDELYALLAKIKEDFGDQLDGDTEDRIDKRFLKRKRKIKQVTSSVNISS